MSKSGYGNSRLFRQFMEAVADAGQPALVVDQKGDSGRIDRIEGGDVKLLYYGPKSGATDPDIIGDTAKEDDNEPRPLDEL